MFSIASSSLFSQDAVHRRPAHAEGVGNRARRLTISVHPLRQSRLLLVKHRAWRHYERTRTARLPACQRWWPAISLPRQQSRSPVHLASTGRVARVARASTAPGWWLFAPGFRLVDAAIARHRQVAIAGAV
jgi:hypothetical protein